MRQELTSTGAQQARRHRGIDLFTGFAAAVAVMAGTPDGAHASGAQAHIIPPSLTISLPNILSAEDAAHYREIFRLQKDGRWAAADRHIETLTDRLLMGHVLFQRYMHPTAYKSSFAELRDWMAQYRDHPDADRIYALAILRKPAEAEKPLSPSLGIELKPPVVVVAKNRPRPDPLTQEQAEIIGRILDLVSQGELLAAEEALADRNTRELLTASAFDRARAGVAMGHFIAGNDPRAYELAAAGAERSRETVSIGHWIAGLAAYRLGRLKKAVVHFEKHALSPAAGPWNISAGAYWAARIHLQRRKAKSVERWLRVAAEHPRTFYGQIARRALGLASPLDWSEPLITQADIERVMELPGGRRAIALVQIGNVILAEEELHAYIWKADAVTLRSILAVADVASLPQTALRAGSRLTQVGGASRDRALYPIPPWRPDGGFKVDRALIFAFMRQESVFDSRATSPVGARGLMQLMPATATSLAEDMTFDDATRNMLYDPELNVSLGQDLLVHLLSRNEVGNDLFKLAVAYNAGAGNLRKWERRTSYKDDPLLFIESLPARETRIFIERVLANFWIYRQRMGQRTTSLDAVAAGDWPKYVDQDELEVMVAEDVAH